MSIGESWYIKATNGMEYGPADRGTLVECARDGRIDASSLVSHDRVDWSPAYLLPELGMRWVCVTDSGEIFGPCHRNVIDDLVAQRQLSDKALVYQLSDFAGAERREAEPLADELAAARDASVAASAEIDRLQKALAQAEMRNRQLSEEVRSITAEFEKAKAAQETESAANATLQAKLKNAEEKIKAAHAKTKQPLRGIFGDRSIADLAKLEQAAQRELSVVTGRRANGSGTRNDAIGDIIEAELLPTDIDRT